MHFAGALAAITSQLTGWVAHHGVYAVFGLMAADAVGGQWENFHQNFRYADYAAVAVVLAFAGAALLHRRRRHASQKV